MSDKSKDKREPKIIFVCSPYGGKHSNLIKASLICAKVKAEGCIPFAPHLYFPSFLCEDIPEDREFGINSGLRFMALADEVWIFIHDGKSAGMKIEEEHARKLGKPVKYIDWDIFDIKE